MFKRVTPDSKAAQFKSNESASGKSMSPPQFKLKADGSSGGETTQMKSNSKLDPTVQAKMEHSLGADFSNVDIVENSSKATESGALAMAQGDSVHFAPGQFKQDTESGQKLLGHELTHVVQQREGKVKANTSVNGMAVNNDKSLENEADRMGDKAARGEVAMSGTAQTAVGGGDAPVQGYFVQNPDSGTPIRVAEDLSVAVPQTGSKHGLYAKAGKAKQSNAQLAGVEAKIELYETGKTIKVSNTDGKEEELVQVLPRNKQNNTKGDNMKLYADCGRSNSLITGSLDREASYTDLEGNAKTTNTDGDPFTMKAAIFMDAFRSWETNPEYANDKKLQYTAGRAKGYQEKMARYKKEYETETDEKKKARAKTSYERYAVKIADLYYTLDNRTREPMDKKLGINDYAMPEVGEGYTMSTGGRQLSGDTWNYHWGGVVMKSNNGKDTIALENFSVSNWNAENTRWAYQMYGPAENDGQTFHDQHKDTKQHGSSPTTMNIGRKN